MNFFLYKFGNVGSHGSGIKFVAIQRCFFGSLEGLIMAFGRKFEEEVVKVETKVWECSSDECKCWLRDNFKSTEIPACPLCNSEMVEATRELQALTNHSAINKATS